MVASGRAIYSAAAAVFSGAMVGRHGAEPPAVAAAYDFSKFQTVVDVGGASGNMLANILARYPQPRGVLFDRPHVVCDAEMLLKDRGSRIVWRSKQEIFSCQLQPMAMLMSFTHLA
jgi:hypothetical protein